MTWEADLSKAPYDAIVARYLPPKEDGGWRVAEAAFDLHGVPSSDGRVQMVLSAPAMRKIGGKIRIDRVEVEYERPPIRFDWLSDLFKKKP